MAKPNMKNNDPRRNADLAVIHMAAKHMFGDVSRGGHGRDDYEAWLERHTGVKSAGKLSKQGRIDLCRRIRRDGIIPDKRKGGKAADRPTPSQWAKITALVRSIGWTDCHDVLDDPRLQSFARRTAKVDATRFLTRLQASKLILGLEKLAQSNDAVSCGVDDAMP